MVPVGLENKTKSKMMLLGKVVCQTVGAATAGVAMALGASGSQDIDSQ
jgi:hypothetical protein